MRVTIEVKKGTLVPADSVKAVLDALLTQDGPPLFVETSYGGIVVTDEVDDEAQP